MASTQNHTVAEMRQWIENNRLVEKYATTQESWKQLRDVYKTSNKVVSTFSKETLRGYLQNIGSYEVQLRNLSRYLYYRSQVYYRLIKYFANMLCLDCRRVIPKIDLTKDEAADFKKRIIESDGSKNSLFAHILKENLIPDADIEMDFESFVSLIKNKVPAEYKHKLEMAVSLNNFYYLVMLRYNYLLCNGQSEKKNFISKWQEIEKQIIPYCENFNPAELFQTMKIQNQKLFDFLFGIKNDLIEAAKTGDFSKVDQRITDRESKLKTTRAKIGHPDKYDVNNLLEYVRFDYRLGTARQHIKDIQEGLKNA